jgi:hypothetical protein
MANPERARGGHRRGRAGLAVLLAGGLGLVLGGVLPALFHLPRAQAQSPAPLDVTLFTPVVRWATAQDRVVRVVLARAGTIRADVASRADDDGDVAARLVADGVDVPIVAGDAIGIHVDGVAPFTRTVPVLSADIDAAAAAIAGIAPPNAPIEARIYRPDGQPVYNTQVASSAEGVYDVPVPGALVPTAGWWGSVTFISDTGDRWRARWDILTAELTMGEPGLAGRASLGSVLGASLAPADGRPVDARPAIQITGGPDYGMAFERGGTPYAWAAGDRLALRVGGAVRVDTELPELTALIDAVRDRVEGQGPVNAPLIVSVGGPVDPIELPATTDMRGRYRVDFADLVDLSAGMPVATRHTRGALTIRARGVREQLTATLHSAWVAGTALPGAWVTANASRRGPSGDERGFGGGTSVLGGRFDLQLVRATGGPPLPLLPGDRLIVAFDAGREPHTIVLPGLVAEPDATTDRVSGIALPLVEVDVRVDGEPGAEFHASADGDGRFMADFVGRYDLQPGTTGTLTTVSANGDAVVLGWAVPVVHVRLGESGLAGIAPRGQAVTVDLSRGGRVVARAEGAAADAPPGGQPNWSLVPRDEGAQPVAIQGGDRLALTVAGRGVDIEVPRLSAEANPAADLIAGSAVANSPVSVTLRRGGDGLHTQVMALSDGRFTLSLAGRWDLAPNDEIEVSVVLQGGHTATLMTRAPGLSVHLDTGHITGYASPFAIVEASLRDGAGQLRGTGTSNASELGRFEIELLDTGGNPVIPVAADTLELLYAGQRIKVTIPRLSATIDRAADSVAGQAEIGGEVSVVVQAAPGILQPEQTQSVTPDPVGAFRADFAGVADIAAGTRVTISYRGVDGHIAWIERLLPIAHLQHGGNLISGWVGPQAAVTLSVWRSGRAVAWASVPAQADGSFDAFVVDATGAPVALAGGDAVDARWSGGASPLAPASGHLQIPVAAITATLDVATGRLVGRGPPLGKVIIHPGGIQSGGTVITAPADAAGAFAAIVPGGAGQPLAAGLAVEAGVLTAEGHRVYTRAIVPYLELTLGQGRITGLAAPLADVEIELDAAGRFLAAGQAHSDTFGRFEGLLRDGDGRIIAPEPGSVLSLVEPGPIHTRLDVPALSIAIDLPGNTLSGIGPANLPLGLRLQVRGRPDTGMDVWTDVAGAWSLDGASLPSGIQLAELTQAEAHARIDNGHQVIAQAIRTPTPTPPPSATPTPTAGTEPSPTRPIPSATPTATRTPGPAGRWIYLPWNHRSARPR